MDKTSSLIVSSFDLQLFIPPFLPPPSFLVSFLPFLFVSLSSLSCHPQTNFVAVCLSRISLTVIIYAEMCRVALLALRTNILMEVLPAAMVTWPALPMITRTRCPVA